MNKKNHQREMFEGDVSKFRFAVVVSRFNSSITSKLLQGVEECFQMHSVKKQQWKVFYCSGAFELPQVANKLAAQRRWDAIICLGAVIRGETPHFEYISTETAHGIQETALRWSIPVVFGVLTTNTLRQAQERVGGKHGHKGWDAALTAFEMASLFQSLNRK